jgi:hypothetical protein
MLRTGSFVSIALSVALLAAAFPAVAQSQDDESRQLRMARDTKWDFFVGPYGWLTGVAGTVVTDGEATEIDVPFTEFLDATRAGLMLYFEARKDRVFVAFDGTWAIIGGDSEGRFFDLDIEVRQQIYDIRVGYEVYTTDIGDVIHRKKFDWQRRGVVDLFIGGRYFRTEPIITFIPVIGEEIQVSSADSRVDPFLGLRVAWDMSYRWAIGFRGDVGGFGIGDAAQFSWQASAQLGLRVSKRVAVFGGYRILEYDTVTGDGLDRNGTDLRQQGPIIGAGISF